MLLETEFLESLHTEIHIRVTAAVVFEYHLSNRIHFYFDRFSSTDLLLEENS